MSKRSSTQQTPTDRDWPKGYLIAGIVALVIILGTVGVMLNQ